MRHDIHFIHTQRDRYKKHPDGNTQWTDHQRNRIRDTKETYRHNRGTSPHHHATPPRTTTLKTPALDKLLSDEAKERGSLPSATSRHTRRRGQPILLSQTNKPHNSGGKPRGRQPTTSTWKTNDTPKRKKVSVSQNRDNKRIPTKERIKPPTIQRQRQHKIETENTRHTTRRPSARLKRDHPRYSGHDTRIHPKSMKITPGLRISTTRQAQTPQYVHVPVEPRNNQQCSE